MTTSLRDGLGGEEMGQAEQQSSSVWLTGSVVASSMATSGLAVNGAVSGTNMWATGSVLADYAVADVLKTSGATVAGTVSATTAVSGLNVWATGSAGADLFIAENQGLRLTVGSPYSCGLIVPFTARAIISGGMFVGMSGGLAYPAAASSKQPIGVATGTAASGATVNVLINGVVPVVAEGTIAINAPAMMGAGAALNCVVAVDAGSGTRAFSCLDAGASGGTVFIRL